MIGTASRQTLLDDYCMQLGSLTASQAVGSSPSPQKDQRDGNEHRSG
jgi:hypothetical protein